MELPWKSRGRLHTGCEGLRVDDGKSQSSASVFAGPTKFEPVTGSAEIADVNQADKKAVMTGRRSIFK